MRQSETGNTGLPTVTSSDPLAYAALPKPHVKYHDLRESSMTAIDVEIPAHVLENGNYMVTVTSPSGDSEYFQFMFSTQR
jgi:hypothetical protein